MRAGCVQAWGILVLTALVLAPLTSGQDAAKSEEEARKEILATDGRNVTFYGHLYSTGRDQPMPMNTQFPLDEDDYSRGLFGGCGSLKGVPMHALGGTAVLAGTAGDCISWPENENWFFSTA